MAPKSVEICENTRVRGSPCTLLEICFEDASGARLGRRIPVQSVPQEPFLSEMYLDGLPSPVQGESRAFEKQAEAGKALAGGAQHPGKSDRCCAPTGQQSYSFCVGAFCKHF